MHLIANGGMTSINISNTIDAIMLTKYVKYVEGVKLDVFKTIDNYFILSEYDDLKNHTLSNKVISKSKYDEIKNTKFPSHIFKYYLPTLNEILKNYVSDKKIFLELHFKDNLNDLYNLLSLYPYEYIILNNSDNYIYCDDPELINLESLDSNTYIITKYPEQFYKKYFIRQN